MNFFVIFLCGFLNDAVVAAEKPAEKANVHLTKIDQLKKTIAASEQELIHLIKEEEKNYQWINELSETLVSLKQKQNDNITALKYQQHKLSKLLRAFRTLSTHTSLIVFASCKNRQDVVYTAILLDKAIRHLKEMALDLRQELSEIENSKEQIAFTEQNLSQSLKAVQQKKSKQEEQLKADTLKLKESLQAFSKQEYVEKPIKIPDNKPVDPVAVKPLKNKLEFCWPLKGKIVGNYGHHPDFFLKGKGIVVESSKASLVFSPQDGIVTRIIDNIGGGYSIIITHQQGYQTALSGVDNIHCYQGQKLYKGQSVGVIEGTLLRAPQLYMQLKCYGRWENPNLFYSKE